MATGEAFIWEDTMAPEGAMQSCGLLSQWVTKDLILQGRGVTCHDHIALFVATKMSIPNEKRSMPLTDPHPADPAAH